MEIYDRKERDLSSLLLGSVSSLVCLVARGTLHLTAKFLVHDVMMFVYYYMKNFCNLIGLEQWYFSLIEVPTCENYKPFVGSSINK